MIPERVNILPAIIVSLGLLLSGCVASQQDVRTLDLRLRTLNNRLDNMDRDLGDLREQTTMRAEKDSVEALQKNLARSTAEMERLRGEMMKLKGNIEEVAHRATISREESQDYVSDLGRRLAAVEEGLKGLDSRLGALEKQVAGLNGSLEERLATVDGNFRNVDQRLAALGEETAALREQLRKAAEEAARRQAEEAARAAREAEEKARRARRPVRLVPRKVKVRGGAAKPLVSPSPAGAEKAAVAAPGPAATGNSLYDAAMADFRAGKYRDAYLKFSTYLEKNPGDARAGDARFLLGDCLYRQKEFALAILEYQKVIDDYRNHPRKPAALLKQGLAFEKLADRKTAKIVYLKLLKLYPGRPEAETARKRLNAMR